MQNTLSSKFFIYFLVRNGKVVSLLKRQLDELKLNIEGSKKYEAFSWLKKTDLLIGFGYDGKVPIISIGYEEFGVVLKITELNTITELANDQEGLLAWFSAISV